MTAETPSAAERHQRLDTSTGHSHGQDRCPKCGSTDVAHQQGTTKLGCRFCRHVWEGERIEEKYGLGAGIENLRGRLISSGASKITDTSSLVTMKCQGCGSEVTVDTDSAMQSQCHWCRSILSINDKIPNGAVPDGILPFSVSREEAIAKIAEFAEGRRFFAKSRFRREFTPENVRGVFLPYMVVDATYRTQYEGVGEVITKKWTEGSKSKTTYYAANIFSVKRQFDVHVDDVLVESSARRANIDDEDETNNVINAILPFDVKNAVAFDSNYLGDFTAEKRDMDVDDAMRHAGDRFLTIGRRWMEDDVARYDRGVRFESEQAWVRGTRWTSVYLPVWLYSYAEKRGDGTALLHYIAVNGRTGTTMGSIPINMAKLRLTALGFAAIFGGIPIPIITANIIANNGG